MRRILLRLLKVLAVLVVAAVAVVSVARNLLLPSTDCVVTRHAVDDVKLEIGFDRVREALGCDGILASREVWSTELTREVYHWRGDAWPFGRFDGLFYNGVLHGKDVRWITLNVGRTPAAVDAEPVLPSALPTKP